ARTRSGSASPRHLTRRRVPSRIVLIRATTRQQAAGPSPPDEQTVRHTRWSATTSRPTRRGPYGVSVPSSASAVSIASATAVANRGVARAGVALVVLTGVARAETGLAFGVATIPTGAF